ncbi:ComEA family DNA-binding protein [Streptomyces sodiiphilus]|uniref:ComEA family DNA-binding protein n=1 Tax=Streptomyces sodiiphilus TaxID=226217 RepID=A0ABP5B115_9ACTN
METTRVRRPSGAGRGPGRHGRGGPGRGRRPHTGPLDPRARAAALLTPAGGLPRASGVLVPFPPPAPAPAAGHRVLRRRDDGDGWHTGREEQSPPVKPPGHGTEGAAPHPAPVPSWAVRDRPGKPSAPLAHPARGSTAAEGREEAGEPPSRAAEPGTGDGRADPAGAPPPGGPDPSEAGPLPVRERWRLAVLERLPLWAQARCGIEPRALIALCAVLAVAAGFAAHHYASVRPRPVPVARAEPVPSPEPGSGAAPADADPAAGAGAAPGAQDTGQAEVTVDVAGEVRNPGVHTLPSGSRVMDAIEAAGGSRPGADTDGLNRARVLADGEHIVVGAPPAGAGHDAALPAGGAPPGQGAGGAISLSTATAEQLQTLPGVGPVLAGNILAYRQQHGGFTSVDQLREVSGIGDRRLADIRDRVTP